MNRDVNEDLELFEKKLANLINECRLESMSDTPDFVVARHLRGCLETYNATIRKRMKWYGRPVESPCKATVDEETILSKNPRKRVHKVGRLTGDGDAYYIIETFPNMPSDWNEKLSKEKKVHCKDCDELVDTFIRVYKPMNDFNVHYRTVCSVCCYNSYEK